MPRTGPTRNAGPPAFGHFVADGHLASPSSDTQRQQRLSTPGKLGVHHAGISRLADAGLKYSAYLPEGLRRSVADLRAPAGEGAVAVYPHPAGSRTLCAD